MRYSLVNGIGGAFIGIGKAFISILTTTIFYFMITRLSTFNSKIISPVLPTIVTKTKKIHILKIFILLRLSLYAHMESQFYS